MSAPPAYDKAAKAPPADPGIYAQQQPPQYMQQQPPYGQQQNAYPQQSPYPPQVQPGYPPPQGNYQQQQQQKYTPGPGGAGQPMYPQSDHVRTQTTIVTQPAVVPTMAIAFHESPTQIICPCCGQHVVTGVRYDNGSMAWLLCVVLCLVGCWPCACIPLCSQGCQDAIHTCPSCHAQVGAYRRM